MTDNHEFDLKRLFDLVSKTNERLVDADEDGVDEDKPFVCWDEDGIHDLIQQEGIKVARQDWDSGGPGAGSGTVDVIQFRTVFIAYDDVDCYGPFEEFAAAAKSIGLFVVTDATTRIWCDVRYHRGEARLASKR